MGTIPLLSSTIVDVITYQIMAKAVISSSGSIPKLESVQLTASNSGGTVTQWSISCEQLTPSLTRIIGKATAAEVLECLKRGQIMRLPGTYTSYEVISLGYRKRSERTTAQKRRERAR